MDKLIFFVLGLFFLYLGYEGLIDESVSGFGTRGGGENSITSADNPIEYYLKILFYFSLGGFLIKFALSTKGE